MLGTVEDRDGDAPSQPTRVPGIVRRAGRRVEASPRRGRGAGALAPSPDEWPQFRGNPRLTGVTSAPAPPLTVLWTHDAGRRASSPRPRSSPAACTWGASRASSSPWTCSRASFSGPTTPGGDRGVLSLRLRGVGLRRRPRGRRARGERPGRQGRLDLQDRGGGPRPRRSSADAVSSAADNQLHALDAWTGASGGLRDRRAGPPDERGDRGLAFVAGCDGELRAIRVADGPQAFAISSGGYTALAGAHGRRAIYGTLEDEALGVDPEVVGRRREPEPGPPFPSTSSAGRLMARWSVGGIDRPCPRCRHEGGPDVATGAGDLAAIAEACSSAPATARADVPPPDRQGRELRGWGGTAASPAIAGAASRSCRGHAAHRPPQRLMPSTAEPK